MPETPTPGQVCYEAWRATQRSGWLYERQLAWHRLDASTQRAWEAAAQAVRAQALADRVWARQASSTRWREGPHEEERPDA